MVLVWYPKRPGGRGFCGGRYALGLTLKGFPCVHYANSATYPQPGRGNDFSHSADGSLMLPSGARELAYYVDALGPGEICRLCCVHRTTFARWCDGTSKVPGSVLLLLKIITSKRLPDMGREWAGWTFQGSDLYTPSNEPISAGEILAIHYRRALIREQQKQIAHLRALVESLTAEIAQLGPAANDGHQWPYEPRPGLSDSAGVRQSAGEHPGHFAKRGRP